MTLTFFEELSNNYLELLDGKEDFNVVINVGESPSVKIFQAHSAILRCRSSYFQNKLNKLANINKDNYIKTLDLKKVSIQQFEILIRYIYGGVVQLDNCNASFIFELMIIAYEFLFEELAKHLETHLIEVETQWLRLHFNYIYQKIFQNNKLQNLQKWCNDILVKYPDEIFNSEDFISLQEDVLVSLIIRDDLEMEEVKIWNRVIDWGIAQNPGLPLDSKDWTHENIQSLKTTLRNCLPLIRYFRISRDDVIDNVQPYQQILEKNLWEDILKRHVSPNRPISETPPLLTSALPNGINEPFSTVINQTHAAEITSWVDKNVNPYSATDNPYEFKLLLRGTRDGFTAESFWNLCDKQKNIVVVMKVKDTDEILGGYNPIGWVKPAKDVYFYKYCEDSFIFSLKNGSIQNSILSRVKNPHFAICCDSFYGLTFGSGSDLRMGNNFNQDRQSWCCQQSYEERIRDATTYHYKGSHSHFSVDEYEVFQISKNYEIDVNK